MIFTAVLDDDVPVMLAKTISEMATADVCDRIPLLYQLECPQTVDLQKHQNNLYQSFNLNVLDDY